MSKEKEIFSGPSSEQTPNEEQSDEKIISKVDRTDQSLGQIIYQDGMVWDGVYWYHEICYLTGSCEGCGPVPDYM